MSTNDDITTQGTPESVKTDAGQPEGQPKQDHVSTVNRVLGKFTSMGKAPEPQQAQQASPPLAGEVIDFKASDGTIRQIQLPADPTERNQLIANLASAQDAYLKGKEILKEKSPELSKEWRDLMKSQSDAVQKLTELQAAQQQSAQQQAAKDPSNMLTEPQRAYYERLKDERSEDEAEAYLHATYTQNLMLYENDVKYQQLQNQLLEQKIANKVSEFVNLDKSLPNPLKGGNVQSFKEEFFNGYGGWLLSIGFDETRIFFSDQIDHEKFYKVYLQETSQSKPTAANTMTPTAKAKAVASAEIDPEVAKSIMDVHGGTVTAPIGKQDSGMSYSHVRGRAGLRNEMNSNPKFQNDVIKGLGLEKFMRKGK